MRVGWVGWVGWGGVGGSVSALTLSFSLPLSPSPSLSPPLPPSPSLPLTLCSTHIPEKCNVKQYLAIVHRLPDRLSVIRDLRADDRRRNVNVARAD